MPSERPADTESADVKRVDAAQDAIAGGDLDRAESLLLAVIANTPADYVNAWDDPNGGVTIKFWDQVDFLHYVAWQDQHGTPRSVNWMGNAYPRAHYYMGFLCVKRQQFDRAIQFLDRGLALEPTNPSFKFEKGQALLRSGRVQQALALFNEVHEIGPCVNPHELALSLRGRGFALIELGRLDEAEHAFRTSLEFEPGNSVAFNELRYIEHLRQGGQATHRTETVSSMAPDPSVCAICGRKGFSKGVVVSRNGMPATICRRCERRRKKKWWQFWK